MSNKNPHVPFVIKPGSDITMYLNGESMTVSIGHPNYNKVIEALKSGETSLLENLIDVAKAVTQYTKGKVLVKNGQIFYGNSPVHNTLTNRVLNMMNEGFKFDHMLLFLENLMANPSFRAVNETYTFLENHGLPITEDGCFLAYKAVRNNYTDIRTGTFDNRVGMSPSMPRNQVDENYEADCSSGLHVGALEYVVSFGHFTKGAVVGDAGNRLLIVKVNPRDVVSVPSYAGHTKMRVATYSVVSEIKDVVKELDKVVYKTDATALTPDRGVDEKTYSDDYSLGYSQGELDRSNGDDQYGKSRDYTLDGPYKRGYNAGFKGNAFDTNYEDNRGVVAETEAEASDWDDENSEDEYQAGYDLGCDDWRENLPYGSSLNNEDEPHSDEFKLGYNDGFNS